jgi:exosortase
MGTVIRARYGLVDDEGTWKFIAVAVAYLVLYAPLYPHLLKTWLEDSNNSHGLLIPIVSLYLLWELRGRVTTTRWNPTVTGFVLLLGSLVTYFVCFVGGVVFPARLTMVTTLVGLVVFNAGWAVFRFTWFPIVFLCFMVPVPDTLMNLVSFPLQLLVSDVSAYLIGLYGLPVYAEGNMLLFARYSFEVTEACSGIRSLISYLAIGALLAFLERDSWVKSVVLVASAVPLALFVNLLRVSGTGVTANYFGTKVAQGFAHDFSGFVVFALGIVLMLIEVWVLKKLQVSQAFRVQKRTR